MLCGMISSLDTSLPARESTWVPAAHVSQTGTWPQHKQRHPRISEAAGSAAPASGSQRSTRTCIAALVSIATLNLLGACPRTPARPPTLLGPTGAALRCCGTMEAPGSWPAAPDEDDQPRASFDELPIELRLKCLASCDWQTLSRAACVNRSVRALVRRSGRCLGRRHGGGRVPRRCVAYLVHPMPRLAGGLPRALALLVVACGGAAGCALHRVCQRRGAADGVHQMGGAWPGLGAGNWGSCRSTSSR